MKKVICIILPIFVGVVTYFAVNVFLDNKIEYLVNSKNLKSLEVAYGQALKDKGVVINEYFNNDNSLIIQGSSELSSHVDQVPTKFFPLRDFDYDIVTNGRAYVQNLQQASILGSQHKEFKDTKIALVVSLQWFENANGISETSFESTFSPVQFYNFLSNSKLSNDLKVRYATRISELLKNTSQFVPEKIYADLFISDKTIDNMLKVLFKPYYFLREKLVTSKDKGLLYRYLINLPDKEEGVTEKSVDWNEEVIKAENQGDEAVNNNNFMVNDEYYDKYLRGNVEKNKDINKDMNLMISKEFDDYKIYLDTCEELGISPYIIIMPTNGLWYDHKGMTKDKRDAFYDEVERLAKEKSFDVLNLKDEEYTPYFMTDVMHLGWKGWLMIDEELYNKYK